MKRETRLGEWIELKANDGFELSAWREAPAGTPRGAVVVVQEIFGVNHHIRSVVHRFAASGFLVLAPALFDRLEPGFDVGYDDESRAKGFAMMGKFDRVAAVRDIAAAIEAAREGGKVGVVGFCLGGGLAWRSSANLPGVAAGVSYYGFIIDSRNLQPKSPMLLHYGERDAHIPIDRIREIVASRPSVEFHAYPADHGFACDERSSFDAESSAIAWGRTLEFLAKQLG